MGTPVNVAGAAKVFDRFVTTKVERNLPSIASLLLMTAVAVYALLDLAGQGCPQWTRLLFIFTIIGGGGGALWEMAGNLNSLKNEYVENNRRANVGIVMMNSMLICAFVGGVSWSPRLALLLAFHGAAMWLDSFLGMAPLRNILYIEASKLFELYLVVSRMAELPSDQHKPYLLLVGGTLANAVSFIAAPISPPDLSSFVFHTINALTTFLTYSSIVSLPKASVSPDPAFVPLLPVLAGIAIAVVAVVGTSRLSYNKARLVVNSLMWDLVYMAILSSGFDNPLPANLATVNDPSQIQLLPYRENKPKSTPLGVPNPEAIPDRQKLNYKFIHMGFALISWLDEYFPHARSDEPLKYKPRIRMDVSCEYYIPKKVNSKMAVMDMTVPADLKHAANDGSDLVWFVLHGHMAPMIRPMPDQEECKQRGPDYAAAHLAGCQYVVDLEWASVYKPNPDYMHYGGKAFFRIFKEPSENGGGVKLELAYLTLPKMTELIATRVGDGAFEKARQAFLATTNVMSVAGYHLAGIHMMYDLVSIALFNAFDHACLAENVVHPFRALLQPHFFNHTMVDVETTPHLMERGAVFNQIWALTHTGICDFVEDFFRTQVDFGAEDDIQGRFDRLNLPDCPPFPASQLDWMLEYKAIYRKYVETAINAIYRDDAAVAGDKAMRKFYKEMDEALKSTKTRGLPDRYGTLSTKAHVARFAEDAIFHVTIIHEMHGTKSPSYALNAQLMQVKVANDLSPPAREDYNSLLMITAATARVHFPKLLDQEATRIFSTVNDGNQRKTIQGAFNTMITEMQGLESRIRAEYDGNHDRLRMIVLPTDIETGAGY